jgi:hypothetical protein
MKRIVPVFHSLLASLFLSTSSWAGVITQGSFERPLVPSGQVLTYSTGNSFKGWKIVGDPGNIFQVGPNFSINGVPFPAQHKKQWVCLTGSTRTLTGVQRTLSLTPGPYKLTFYVGNINDPAHGLGLSSTVRVFVNGTEVLPATNTQGDATHFVWKKFSRTITATDATTLAFYNGDPSTDGINGLDHISLTALSP